MIKLFLILLISSLSFFPALAAEKGNDPYHPSYDEFKQREGGYAVFTKSKIEAPGQKTISLADDGDLEAQYIVGRAYFVGYAGMKSDPQKGIEWIRKSAMQGFRKAQKALADIYAQGAEVKQDWAEAYFWDSLAAKALYDYRFNELALSDDRKHLTTEQKIALDERVKEWKPEPTPANLNLDTVDGVYKKTFQNGDVTGEKWQSEDILEIVKYTADKAYIRVELPQYNGGNCAISGLATVKANTLVLGRETPQKSSCVLTLGFFREKILFDDANGECYKETCGMRGGYMRVSFDRSKRRKIRYMGRLLASPQYTNAIKYYEANKSSLSPNSSIPAK